MSRTRFASLLLVAVIVTDASAAPSLDQAIGQYQARQYAEARAAFEAIVAAEPQNARACYYLGMAVRRRGDAKALDDAVVWLERAVKLEPDNATYLADFGGTSLQVAQKNTSYSAATRGRDALEKSLVIDPTNIDARIGLMQFYQRAPWPLGSKAKAAAQLDAIRQLDADRATVLEVTAKTAAKDYAAAFSLCETALARQPDDYVAHYQFGRTASIAGQRLEEGLAHLQKCLAAPEPGGAAPTHSDVWNRIGVVHEKRGFAVEARSAYENAVKLNPANRAAADSLARLKSSSGP